MQFSASQIALLIQGTVEGNANASVAGFGKIEIAQPGQISFLANPKYEDFLYSTQASIVIVNTNLVLKQPVKTTLIRVADAYSAFAQLLTQYQNLKTQQLQGISQQSFVAENASLGTNVYIEPFVYIGSNAVIGNNVKIFAGAVIGDQVVIGNDCLIGANVTIYAHCEIGTKVTIHAGAVIGSDGFGFAPQADGSYAKIPQIGNVIIENNVEIGANTTIDRATIGSTIVRAGAKIDNLVQIAHNVEIGNHTVIASQAGISGSTKIGTGVMVGGQAGFAGHIVVANGTKIGGQSGITRSINTPNTSVNDTPAFDYKMSLRSQIVYKNLPQLSKKVDDLEKLIVALQEQIRNKE